MSNQTVEQVTKQAETLFAGPFRNYASLAIEHFEKLAAAQLEASRAYSEAGLKQARAALEVRDQAGFQSYVESQQKAAKELSEQIQGDTQKFAVLNEEFARNAQKLVESDVQTATKATQAK